MRDGTTLFERIKLASCHEICYAYEYDAILVTSRVNRSTLTTFRTECLYNEELIKSSSEWRQIAQGKSV